MPKDINEFKDKLVSLCEEYGFRVTGCDAMGVLIEKLNPEGSHYGTLQDYKVELEWFIENVWRNKTI